VTAVAVPDSSCLIGLEQIGLLWVLPSLFAQVVAPPSVLGEAWPTLGVQPPWLRVERAEPALPPPGLDTVFGLGEREVIGLALAIAPDAVVLDDRDARRWAIRRGLPVVGTAGILLRAKTEGALPRLGPALDRLREARFFLSDRLYRSMLAEAGEAAP